MLWITRYLWPTSRWQARTLLTPTPRRSDHQDLRQSNTHHHHYTPRSSIPEAGQSMASPSDEHTKSTIIEPRHRISAAEPAQPHQGNYERLLLGFKKWRRRAGDLEAEPTTVTEASQPLSTTPGIALSIEPTEAVTPTAVTPTLSTSPGSQHEDLATSLQEQYTVVFNPKNTPKQGSEANKSAAGSTIDPHRTCRVCQTPFTSRNALFAHL